MILSCPSCATQYKVNDSVLGARGRTVRCAACKSTWHAEVPIDLRYSEGRRPEEVIEAEAKPDLRTVKAKKLPGKYRAMLEAQAKLRAVAIEGMIWGGLAALAVLVLALGYFLRVDVVRAFPRIAGAYAMVGLKVNGTSLQFGTYTADAGLKGGRFIVTVKAQVKNVSDKPVPVPPVRVRLYDGTLQQFNSVLIQAGDLVVAPNATRTLTFDVNDPKNQVASLDLGFDLEAMKAMKNHPAAKTKAPVAAHAVAENGSEDTAPHDAPAAIATPPAAMDTDNGEGASAGGQDADAQPLSNRSSPELRTALPPSQAHGTGHG